MLVIVEEYRTSTTDAATDPAPHMTPRRSTTWGLRRRKNTAPQPAQTPTQTAGQTTDLTLVRTAPSMCEVSSLASYLTALANSGTVRLTDTADGMCVACCDQTGDIIRALHITGEPDEKACITRMLRTAAPAAAAA